MRTYSSKNNRIDIKIGSEIYENKIPKSPMAGYSYQEFCEICEGYYEELLQISKESIYSSLSKDTIISIDSLINEITKYSIDLMNNSLIEEAKKIINNGLLISDTLIKILDSTQDPSIKKYPLSLKLMLLERLFNIVFKYEKDYYASQTKLNEIIEIQMKIRLPKYNIASSKFYMALIKFFLNDFEESEKYAIEAKNILENNDFENCLINNNDNDKRFNFGLNYNEVKINDNLITNKMSEILGFLAEIYRIKKEYQNALSCSENAYYLNLGRYGESNANTEYYKNQLDLIREEFSRKNNNNNNNNNYNNINNNDDNDDNDNNDINEMTKKITDESFNDDLNNKEKNTVFYKGKTYSFCFKIPLTALNEPLYISIYRIGDSDCERYSPELFVSKLSFNKIKIFEFLNEKQIENDLLYNDENLKKVLSNIKLMNRKVAFYNDRLKKALFD